MVVGIFILKSDHCSSLVPLHTASLYQIALWGCSLSLLEFFIQPEIKKETLGMVQSQAACVRSPVGRVTSSARRQWNCHELPDTTASCPKHSIRRASTNPKSQLYKSACFSRHLAEWWGEVGTEQARVAKVPSGLANGPFLASFRNLLWKTCWQRRRLGTPAASRTCSRSSPTTRRSWCSYGKTWSVRTMSTKCCWASKPT